MSQRRTLPHASEGHAPRQKRLTARQGALLGVLVVVPASLVGVMACGPFFPEPLLNDRTHTLEKLPSFSFSYAIRHLYPGQKVTPEPSPGSGAMSPPDEDSPAEARARDLYQSGAQAYRDPSSADHGIDAFKAVLALPDASNAHEKVAAAFMLGKAYSISAFASANDPEHDLTEAARAFALTRSLVEAGAYDPDALAQASWGEEAKLYLRGANGLCGWREMETRAPCTTSLRKDLIGKALLLYVHQVESGSYAGEDSLRYVLAWVSQYPDLVRALAADPLSRKLLSAYALSFDYDGDLAHSSLKNLATAVHEQGVKPDDGTDLLAAAAYRQGQFDLARDFAAQNSSPLAAWVRAKLAVRANDTKAATLAYAEATKGFPTLAPAQDPAIAVRMQGEQGVLALSRGEYVQALLWLYKAAQQAGPGSDVGIDAAYVAERVLSVDELMRFVDANVPSTLAKASGARPSGVQNGQTEPAGEPPVETMPDVMRSLLVRRLIRENRFAEALNYTDHDHKAGFALESAQGQPLNLTYDQLIQTYAQALSDAKSRWTRAGRAEAWFLAARIVKLYGMELTGTELGPDYHIWGGTYGWGADIDPRSVQGPAAQKPPASRTFVTAQEIARFDSSAVKPDARYHYRWLAVSYASRAADLLPPRSQAFAAVLCQAAGWQTDQTQALYRRYVREGALVDFAPKFGNSCTVRPAFEQTRFYGLRKTWQRVRTAIARRL
ncbi:hypothetical protein [Asaia bogorensis]|uniref:hypothetical protein n=1 Tax=Asaia bogorensis TaxID=91915 RepID=UPI0011BD4502|nr:hypothetical protein [Asaia bogorensis]